MPRQPRVLAPDAVIHVICRFVDGRFEFDDDARREYLDRLPRALGASDWRLLAYGLMSNHVHLALLTGNDELDTWIRPLHTGTAQWLNRRRGRLTPGTRGHVFAERPKTKLFHSADAGVLLAYIHNNPVRAGLVEDPAASTWTSHRSYVGLSRAPAWLDVGHGMELSGFAAHERSGFHRFVCARGEHALALPPLEAGPSIAIQSSEPSHEADSRVSQPDADPRAVVLDAARRLGADPRAVLGGSRKREAVEARRVALLAWRELVGTAVAMRTHLGISSAGASQLLHRRTSRTRELESLAMAVCATMRLRK